MVEAEAKTAEKKAKSAAEKKNKEVAIGWQLRFS